MPEEPVEIFRKDYKPADYTIDRIRLIFKLFDSHAEVATQLSVKRAPHASEDAPLRLDGEELELKSIALNGSALDKDKYTWVTDDKLELAAPLPAQFTLDTVVHVKPHENTQLQGLYVSSGVFCTQCEAEGFRRITLMQDRPDIMSKYSVRIEADKSTCPVLLSNGNLSAQGDVDGGRHFTEWDDPFLKPSYLFALVAGDLGCLQDTFTTRSGRAVQLKFFSEHDNVAQLGWAMASLKQAMTWDEDVFNLEYDLDVFHAVAVKDYTMGAMENKSLNVFNTSCVLASPTTARDSDYENIQGTVAHEYFHNWTGNRVTCRDWFQLTLKEGLTVFRDQEFSRDMTSEIVKRINDVRILRTHQFPEDSGPMAHPIRPESYIAMDNFYTATVYEKGAEVIRMYQTLLGRQGFMKGMALYFKRHDGCAVTCDDFRAAMADANGVDLTQFERWYTQAGTPTVECVWGFDVGQRQVTVTLKQSTRPTPGQDEKLPLHIPVRVGVLSRESGSELCEEKLLELTQTEQTFTIDGVTDTPVLSVLRGFCAPVKLVMQYSDEDLAFLMARDTDSFNRWEAGQTLFTRAVLANVTAFEQGKAMSVTPLLVEAVKKTLLDESIERSLQAFTITMPSLSSLAEELSQVDPDSLVAATKFVEKTLAAALRDQLLQVYSKNVLPKEPFRMDAEAVGMRRIKNACLKYIMSLDDTEGAQLALKQCLDAGCMTDLWSSTMYLASSSNDQIRKDGLEHFFKQAQGNDLSLCKWFTIQAVADRSDVLSTVTGLLGHPDFSLKNPNKCRALCAFQDNMRHFHAKDGSGYAWITDRIIEVDKITAQVSARLVSSLSSFRKFDPARQALMKAQLERLAATEGLSKDAFEIVSRSLKG